MIVETRLSVSLQCHTQICENPPPEAENLCHPRSIPKKKSPPKRRTLIQLFRYKRYKRYELLQHYQLLRTYEITCYQSVNVRPAGKG